MDINGFNLSKNPKNYVSLKNAMLILHKIYYYIKLIMLLDFNKYYIVISYN